MRSVSQFTPLKERGYARFLTIVILVLILLIIGIPLLSGERNIKTYLINGGVTLLMAGFFLWIWFDTQYTIHNNRLIVKSGPIRMNINIADIYLIRLNQDTFAGSIKLSLAWKSMEIKYKKYRTVSISPANEKEFLDVLQKINPTIKIKD